MADLISKNDLLLSLAEYVNSNAYLNQTALDALLMVMRWVKEDPAVDAVPVVHAYWMSGTHCSNCRGAKARPWAGYLEHNANTYCHVCGAKMDGGAEG